VASAHSGYTLVICEKPDAARRIAEALSSGTARRVATGGVETFRFASGGEDFVVCAAAGHLYSVSDPFEERGVYPVFDLEWYPSDEVGEKAARASLRIGAIRALAAGAAKFINACDFDPEGETIGFNVLRYACGGKEGVALRAKFSSLTRDELVAAFREAAPQAGQGQARAGRARHVIDFAWGINLSRALSQAARSGHGYTTISMGRVQGPTLAFLAEREEQIRTFVPAPYWNVAAVFEGGGTRFSAPYSKEKVRPEAAAERVRGECLGKEGVVTDVRKTEFKVPPPPPFATGDLQREAYRTRGLAPSRTLQIAERLYLKALISYPRTSSQRLPPSLDCRAILRGLARMSRYSKAAGEALMGPPKPAQGAKSDPAHPAIHPTGEVPSGDLSSQEAAVFDLVVRRFLAGFAPPEGKEQVTVKLAVGAHEFVVSRVRGLREGETGGRGGRSYWAHALAVGDRLKVAEVSAEERMEQGPPWYDQGTLLGKMEEENIGTKATRADVISTLVERGYAEGARMRVTGLGMAVYGAMRQHSPGILTVDMTRGIEKRIEAVEAGSARDHELIRETVRSIADQLVGIRESEGQVGSEIGAAVAAAAASRSLGPCPVCGSGTLVVIRSRSTKKRFVGCSRYNQGCRASAPLPQRGTVRAEKQCPACSWPVVMVTAGGRPWKLCVNPACPAKGEGLASPPEDRRAHQFG